MVLAEPIYVTAITIEHVERAAAKNILSAPREFQVIGYSSMDSLDMDFMEDDDEETDGGDIYAEEPYEVDGRAHLRGEHDSDGDSDGQFRRRFRDREGRSLLAYGNYGINYIAEGGHVQTFPVTSARPMLTHIVKLNVLSNYGNDDFTCLYRFKVHGTTTQPDSDSNTDTDNGPSLGRRHVEQELL
mgnify:CR=1 FL=1